MNNKLVTTMTKLEAMKTSRTHSYVWRTAMLHTPRLCITQIVKAKNFKKIRNNLQAMDLEIKLGMHNIKLWL
jgi:hypothetical protein